MIAVLSTDEPIQSGVRRILVLQLEHIGKALERHPLSDDNVHSVRKGLKRARACVRLLRNALGIAEYRRLNQALRDAARPLALMRDAKVLLHALDKVVEQSGKSLRISISSELRRSLQQELDLNHRQLGAKDIAAMRRRLNMVGRCAQKLTDARLDRADVEVAIRRAHKKARKAFKLVEREPGDENLHEWRKQVKYEFNQLELLQPLKPKRIDAIIRQARKIGDLLGDDHDLAVLHERIAAQSQQANSAEAVADAEALLAALKPLRAKLQRKAHRAGKKLYADGKPKKLKI